MTGKGQAPVTGAPGTAPKKGMDTLAPAQQRRVRSPRPIDDGLTRYVAALVDAAPPLTPEQAQRLRVLLGAS